MLLYYITDRGQFSGDAGAQRRRLLQTIAAAALAGVDYIQLREKDLSIRDLEPLAREAAAAVRGTPARLLINSRTDVAIAAGAHGVHLRADDIPASDARAIFHRAGIVDPIIAVSCHSADEVALAESHGADFVVFGPVFEKEGAAAAAGLERLRAACGRHSPADPRAEGGPPRHIPVLALGGVTLDNAAQCIEAGAAGTAAVRLFQQPPERLPHIVAQLKGM